MNHVLDDIVHNVEEGKLGDEVVSAEHHDENKVIQYTVLIVFLHPWDVLGHFTNEKLGKDSSIDDKIALQGEGE